jgi:hypothetical protein
MQPISHPDRFETWANGLACSSMAIALLSYYQHNAVGMLLGVLAVLIGGTAIAMSLLPAVRRDFGSTLAITAGLVGVVAAAVRLIGGYNF